MPVSSWSQIKSVFDLDDSRYLDFKFLEFLDINDFYVRNYVNYILGNEEPIIVGRLRAHLSFWESINAPDWILSIVKDGFTVPFYKLPPPIYLPNNKSSLNPAHKRMDC